MRIPNLEQALEIGLSLQTGEWDESRLHVSDLSTVIPGEGCPRQLWLRLKGAAKRPLTVGQQWRFRTANRIHEDLTELLEIGLPGDWRIEAVEIPVEFDCITGRADLVIEDLISHDFIVIDYKTSRGRSFHYNEFLTPKESHAMQVRGYCYGLKYPKGAAILNVDREGDNSFRQSPPSPEMISRDDNTVKKAIEGIKEIKQMPEPPAMLTPYVEITENKGPDAVRLNMPWLCDYCQYRDASCEAALPKDYRDLGIVGYMDGEFTPYDKKKARKCNQKVEAVVNDLLVACMVKYVGRKEAVMPF